MGSGKQISVSARDRQKSILSRLEKLEQSVGDRRRSSGYNGATEDAMYYQRLRDALRVIIGELRDSFFDEENERAFAGLSGKGMTKNAGKDRI